MTGHPIKYFNGEIVHSPIDIPGPTGDWFGFQRSYNNMMTSSSQTDFNGPVGYDWFPTQTPFAAKGSSGSVQILTSPNDSVWFTYSSGSYSPMFAYPDRVVSLTDSSGLFTYTQIIDGAKTTITFQDFTQTTNPQGQMYQYTDPFGTVTQAVSYSNNQITELQRAYTSGGNTITWSLLFTINTSGTAQNRLQSVTLRNKLNSGSWTTVRQASYTYYDGTDNNGSINDLKFAKVQDGSSNTIDSWYYRYYSSADLAGSAPGFIHGLKYVVSPRSYTRLLTANSVSDPSSLSNSTVASYADNYFEYDSYREVTKEIAQGAGCSCSGGSGQGTFTYSRSTNGNSGYSDGYNTWKFKTVETLPDSNTNTVYSDYAGEPMLVVYSDGTNKWGIFYKYDSQNNLTWEAEPSALSLPASLSTLEAYNDLLHSVSGNYQYLNDSSGLIHVYDYASSTTATSSTPGNVSGYQIDEKVQQGETATPITLRSYLYTVHTADKTTAGDGLGGSVYPTASVTEYNGTTSPVTSYSYTWATSSGLATNIMASRTTTLPLISTTQNGPGGSAYDVTTEVYDSFGRMIWAKDADGFINYFARDLTTGALTKQIIDVNTANTGDFANLPSGWSTVTGGGLHLISNYTVDGLGRRTKLTDPIGNVTYTIYNDAYNATTGFVNEVRVYPGWQSATAVTSGPVQVIHQNRLSSVVYNEMLTMAPSTINTTSGAPNGTESISNVQTLYRDYLDNSNRVSYSDVYFNESSYSTSTSLGTQNTNFYRTTYGFDTKGRKDRLVNALGTITRRVYDTRDRVASVWVGTNDSPSSGSWSPTNNSSPCNMIKVTDNQYDSGSVGDGLLTQVTTYVDSTSGDNRVTGNWYDWRDRLVATKTGLILSSGSESLSSENDGTRRQLYISILDSLGKITENDTYDGDFVAASISSGTLNLTSGYGGYLRAKSVINYDDQNRAYQTLKYSVDQSAGTVSTYALTTNIFFNHRGQTIEISKPGGIIGKTIFDSAGRVTNTYSTDGGVVNSASYAGTWTGASSLSNDLILEETINSYDSDGNVILTTAKQHNHDDANTGELGNASTTPKARVSYEACYYDAGNRPTTRVSVGTNSGSSYTRPSSPPSRGNTALETSFTYNPAGWPDTITDPKGIVTANYYDMMERTTRQIEAYNGVTPPNPSNLPSGTTSTDRATVWTYDGLSHILTLQAVMPSGTNSQTSQYNYGVTTSGSSSINSNDFLASIQYPNSSTGSAGTASSDKTTFTYNAIGQQLTFVDQNGTTHTYTYDLLGRTTIDAVAMASGNPQNLDTSVLRQSFNFDTGGRLYQLTQYNAASGGSIVNQVQEGYNGLGQLTNEYQEHGGSVSTSTSLQVQYAYTLMSGGANNSRTMSTTYPNSRVLDYVYNSGLDGAISRISGLKDDNTGTHIEDYSYLGAGSIVQRAHSEPNVNQTLIQQSGDTSYNNDGGDQYTGLDRFNRVIDQFWTTTTDRFQYSYDRDGNALYKNNLQNSGLSELYHANSATSGDNASSYDNLSRLAHFVRGALSASGNNGTSGLGSFDTVSTASSLAQHSESWTLDTLGNWSSQTVDGTATGRTHNSKNEVTAVGSNSLTFDNDGNTTIDQAGNTYTYDAWNRLVTVKNSGGATLAGYIYDAKGWREKEIHGSTTTDCYFNKDWQLIEERQSAIVTNQYIWSLVYIDGLILRDDNTTSGNLGISGSGLGRRLYAQQDANWNITTLLDMNGAVQERFVYDPYGNAAVLNASGAATTDSLSWLYLHQGGRLDAATGLYSYRHRCYSELLGRWMQQDPLGAKYIDGMNIYQYVQSNPVLLQDPLGLCFDPGGCPCKNFPDDCYLEYTFYGYTANFVLFSNNQPDSETAMVSYGVDIKSRTGQDVSNCHLHQSASGFMQSTSPQGAQIVVQALQGNLSPGESVTQNVNEVVVNAPNDYHDWPPHLTDSPHYDGNTDTGVPQFVYSWFFSARDYVEEAPTVQSGIVAFANFGFNTRIVSFTAISSDDKVSVRDTHNATVIRTHP